MVANYKQGWHIDKHFTTFAMRFNTEQAKLLKDNITISDVHKKHHLMVDVWGHSSRSKVLPRVYRDMDGAMVEEYR